MSQVAVKIFETQTEIEAFRNEVEVLASVSHPNIIELYGKTTIYYLDQFPVLYETMFHFQLLTVTYGNYQLPF